MSLYKLNSNKTYCEEKRKKHFEEAGKVIDGLPFYTEENLLEHGKNSQRIWISYKDGVYDITDFMA